MRVDEFVQNLNDDSRLLILKDYEQFRRDGSIGDCALRNTTEQLMATFHTNEHVVFWMEQLAMACYRYYGKKYLKEYFNAVFQLPT